MKEILPGVWQWTTHHEKIGFPVQSYFLTGHTDAVLIDPRVPDEGLDAIGDLAPPAHALLTNRHHFRHSGKFRDRFGTTIWCHSAGLHEFGGDEDVEAFEFGDELPGGIEAVEIGVLCPEETALWRGDLELMAIGDAAVHQPDGLTFVPDEHLGDDPEAVKAGLRAAILRALEGRDVSHLLLAHGEPILHEGGERLRALARGA